MGKITVDDVPRTYALEGSSSVANVFELVGDDILGQGASSYRCTSTIHSCSGTTAARTYRSWLQAFVPPMELRVLAGKNVP
ncbi:MAG: hypothetical protein U1D30_00225 [Planctomycetota bacterium]